ncbi:alpha/beta hydrolase [Acetobacter sp. DsW_063]|uniref:alpha/beta hydrolase n=1 Tax=Acetobacter sp. DsW_063 TaxID=1514894 RepID=UPI001302B65E|nr:alpha/beta hydrolase [Acetobacter sp. DsW_063]
MSIIVKPFSDKTSIRMQRRLLQMNAKTTLPIGMTREDKQLGGTPVSIFRPPQSPSARCIFYMHGGGHLAGSPDTHANFLTLLGMSTGLDVIATDHRLAPEHPFPAGLNDVTAAYDTLIETGVPAENIILMGESAGGNFVFALLHELCSRGTPPGLAIALSPWTDLTASGPSYRYNAKADRVLVPRAFKIMSDAYAPQQDLNNPLISPVFGDFTGAPPVLIEVAKTEILFSDADLMAQRLRTFGTNVDLHVWPDALHTFQVVLPNLKESHDALQKIVDFIKVNSNHATSSEYLKNDPVL